VLLVVGAAVRGGLVTDEDVGGGNVTRTVVDGRGLVVDVVTTTVGIGLTPPPPPTPGLDDTWDECDTCDE